MEKVKKAVAVGVKTPNAIKDALDMSVSDFADKHGLNRTSVTNHINAVTRPSDETIEALVAELGGTPDEWRELLWQAARPEPTAKSA